MIFNRVTFFSSFLMAVFAVTGCTNTQSIVDKNARNAVSQIEKLHFDPNTRPITADNIHATSKVLNQFYVLGNKDRESGVNKYQAQTRVNSFSRMTSNSNSNVDDLLGTPVKGPFSDDSQKSVFINQTYSAEQPSKQGEILLSNAIKTYWDGYYGRK